MKYCEEFAALLDPFVDGELTAEERVRVQAHLDTCPGCRAYVDHALAIRAAFPLVEEAEVPDGFADGVCAAVRMTPQAKKKTPWVKVLAPLAACLVVVVVLQSGPLESHGGSMAPRLENAAWDTAAPEAAMAADEEAIPEDAPALYTLDGGETTGAENGPTEDAPALSDEATKANVRYTGNVIPFEEMTLTAQQAGELLTAYTPVSQEDGTLTYHLTPAEYEELLTALAEANVPVAAPTASAAAAKTDGAFALVIVTP